MVKVSIRQEPGGGVLGRTLTVQNRGGVIDLGSREDDSSLRGFEGSLTLGTAKMLVEALIRAINDSVSLREVRLSAESFPVCAPERTVKRTTQAFGNGVKVTIEGSKVTVESASGGAE